MPGSRHSTRAVIVVSSLLFWAAAISSALIFNLPSDQAAQGWIQLFDGSTRFGWTSNGGNWQVSGNALVSDPAQQSSLRTTTSFSDFDLKFEARTTGPATLLLRADPQSKPAQLGFTLSLNNGAMDGISGGSAAAASTGWNFYEVRAEGTHLIASLNGTITADGKSAKNRVGYFEFIVPKGTRLDVRSVLLKPLGLDPLYNGANLDGWQAKTPPPPENKSKLKLPFFSGKPKPPQAAQWSGQSTIHGQGGVGQLETSNAYDDFVLQFTAKAENKEGHDGVELFFRGTPNQYGSGYAVSLDSGTGSLVKLDPSRTPGINVGQLFFCTVVARAHRLSIWINGVLATDYYDARPEGTYHAAAGPLGFRIQNNKATLVLQDVKIATLAKGPEPPPPPTPVAAAPAPSAANPAAAPAIVLPGQSPQEKAQQEQVRQLTVQALAASAPEEEVRINKQILMLEPGDMPAQQRLDKAQAQIDATNSKRQQDEKDQQAASAKQEANGARRDELLAETQNAILRGSPYEARAHLNDARRRGAGGPEVDRLQSLIESRIRNRLMLRAGLAGGGVCALIAGIVVFWRRRGKTLTAYLVALDGFDKGKRYLLNQEVTHIGGVAMDGGKKNEVLVRDPDRQVSRFHCEIHKRGNHCYLIDLDSSNGTFMHNRQLQPGMAIKLRAGDRFTLARAASFELHLERQ
jgi:hypothetical protein